MKYTGICIIVVILILAAVAAFVYFKSKKNAFHSATGKKVPKNSYFTQGMNLLLYLTEKYPKIVELQLFNGASKQELKQFQQKNNVQFTEELMELFAFTNGLKLSNANLEIMPLSGIEKHMKDDQPWNEGGELLQIGYMIGDGEVVLLNQTTGHIIARDNYAAEKIEYETFADLLDFIIDIFIADEIEDEKLGNATFNP
ncbi:MAG: hypothetical protein MJ071_07175 [Oscillospiraceae bacterium]|nr:hypothetical protein [Oscillospiraceae bacterium]